MIYQSPKELGALWTDVNAMMKKLGAEQSILITKQMQRKVLEDKRKAARMRQIHEQLIVGVAIVVLIFVMGGMFIYVAYDRQQKYPQYGNDLFPKTEQQRREESLPKKYVGR